MNPQGQQGQPGQPQYPQSSPNGVPPIPNNPWQQAQQLQQPQSTQPLQQAPQPMQQFAHQPTDPWQTQQPAQFAQPQAQPAQQPNYNAPEYSIDYLNQIAPKQQKATNRFAVLSLIVVGIITAIFAVFAIASSQGPSVNDQLAPVAERITSLEAVTTAEQKHLSENEISEANAVLNSSLTSMNTDLTTIMKARKLKVPKSTSSKAYTTDLTKILEDSYQRGTLDRTYTAQMTYELTLLRSKISTIKKQTGNKDLSAFCDSSISSIDIVLKAYADFDATKS